MGEKLILAEVYTLLILTSDSLMRTPRFVCFMHLNPERDFDFKEPDYGLQSDLNVDHFRQLAPGLVSFILQ